MSAGTGIRHAEFNRGECRSSSIRSGCGRAKRAANRGGTPSCFQKGDRSGRFVVLASGSAADDGALPIRADARVLGAILKQVNRFRYELAAPSRPISWWPRDESK